MYRETTPTELRDCAKIVRKSLENLNAAISDMEAAGLDAVPTHFETAMKLHAPSLLNMSMRLANDVIRTVASVNRGTKDLAQRRAEQRRAARQSAKKGAK